MKLMKRSAMTYILVVCMLSQTACPGGSFNLDLRGIFNASPAFIDSLELGEHRAAVAKQFVTLGNGSATLYDELKACDTKPCDLDAVEKFQGTFFTVTQSDEIWGKNPKLEKIKKIAAGLLLAARIYYGAEATSAATEPGMGTEKDIKARIEKLKAAMQP